MKAAERIAYYASRFPLVEIDATARFPPTPDLSRQWVDRTPADFTIDVAAWTLLCGGAALPDSLWEDLREEVRPELRDRRRLLALAVELTHRRWLEARECEATLEFLEEQDLGFVCVDPREGRPVVATTSDLAVVRFGGRNPGNWEEPDLDIGERYAYRYTAGELASWVGSIGELASAAAEVHVLFSNCWRDDAVVNAAELTALLAAL